MEVLCLTTLTDAAQYANYVKFNLGTFSNFGIICRKMSQISDAFPLIFRMLQKDRSHDFQKTFKLKDKQSKKHRFSLSPHSFTGSYRKQKAKLKNFLMSLCPQVQRNKLSISLITLTYIVIINNFMKSMFNHSKQTLHTSECHSPQ